MCLARKAIDMAPTTESIHIGNLVVLRALPAQATRRPTLFVHGIFGQAVLWSEWLTFFAERGFPAYAVNLRGRGGSVPNVDLGRATIGDFADDVRAVLTELARDGSVPALVGHSMGGLIAQRVAADGGVAAVALAAPAPPRGISVLSPSVAIKQLKYLPAILLSHVLRPDAPDLRELVLNGLAPSEQDAALAQLVPDSGRAAREMSFAGVPVDASRMACPVLVVSGDDDRFIPRRIAVRVARRYGAPMQTFAGRAHMLVIEPDWQAVADAIVRWLP